jgi:dienelactone hydrolase
MKTNLVGAYGEFLSRISPDDPPALSFRRAEFTDLTAWRQAAMAKMWELIAPPDLGSTPEVQVVERRALDGLTVEVLCWRLPAGPPTHAVFLKPEGADGPLPGVLALHDHGGLKYFGYRKIADDGSPLHPMLRPHREGGYGGRAWANELARRGYAVLCHDGFPFGSRRVRVADVPDNIRWGDARDVSPDEAERDIIAYNQWAAQHEDIWAKSLCSAGTTWPGMFLTEDQRALDVLCSRPEVDAERVGCCGLSGGGVRTVYLAGLDQRIRCAVDVGLMTTWRDGMLDKGWTWTWMVWTWLLPQHLDFPEILGLRVPLPIFVQNNLQDDLFGLEEMRRADDILGEVYRKAGASERYLCRFYPGPHKFDVTMQEEAFDWFGRWL